jgi:predicted nucleic acid-binding protein
MSYVLVDSSVWIEYFGVSKSIEINQLEELIDNNQICINDLILSEILPSLYHQKQKDLIEVLKSIRNIKLKINWEEIIELQRLNLKNGINKVGVPDLIIVQNVLQNGLRLYSFDKHFHIMANCHRYVMV